MEYVIQYTARSGADLWIESVAMTLTGGRGRAAKVLSGTVRLTDDCSRALICDRAEALGLCADICGGYDRLDILPEAARRNHLRLRPVRAIGLFGGGAAS